MHELRCFHPRYDTQNIFFVSQQIWETIGNVIITSNRFKVKWMRAARNDFFTEVTLDGNDKKAVDVLD